VSQAAKVPQEDEYKRKRPNRENKPNLKSRYSFKVWKYNKEGQRIAVPAPNRHKADLINTSYYNPAKNTNTVHCLAFDLDYGKADTIWKSKQKLNWDKIKNYLVNYEPTIFKTITNVARSTSGQGLGIAIAISPLEIVAETKRAQAAALAAQNQIITILSKYGMGADPAAKGLIRDMPNWLDSNRCIYENDIQKRRANLERVAVVADILKVTNRHHFIKEQKDNLLWPNQNAEKKLAKLYIHLLEEHFDSDVYFSSTEIKGITELSKDTLYKFLNTGASWISIERISNFEGYRLRLVPGLKFTDRARLLLSDKPIKGAKKKPLYLKKGSKDSTANPFSEILLDEPGTIIDGERNTFITAVCLALKHVGVEENLATNILYQTIQEIPSYTRSRNCSQFTTILKSIYRNRPELFGIKSIECLPGWLLEKTQKGFDETEFPVFAKKGIPAGYYQEEGNFKRCAGTRQYPLEVLAEKPVESNLSEASIPVAFSPKVDQYQPQGDLQPKEGVKEGEGLGPLSPLGPLNPLNLVTPKNLDGLEAARFLQLMEERLERQNRNRHPYYWYLNAEDFLLDWEYYLVHQVYAHERLPKYAYEHKDELIAEELAGFKLLFSRITAAQKDYVELGVTIEEIHLRIKQCLTKRRDEFFTSVLYSESQNINCESYRLTFDTMSFINNLDQKWLYNKKNFVNGLKYDREKRLYTQLREDQNNYENKDKLEEISFKFNNDMLNFDYEELAKSYLTFLTAKEVEEEEEKYFLEREQKQKRYWEAKDLEDEKQKMRKNMKDLEKKIKEERKAEKARIKAEKEAEKEKKEKEKEKGKEKGKTKKKASKPRLKKTKDAGQGRQSQEDINDDRYDEQYAQYAQEEQYDQYEYESDEESDERDERDDLVVEVETGYSYAPKQKSQKARYIPSKMSREQQNLYNAIRDPNYKDQYTFFWERNGYPKRLVEFIFDPKEIQPCFSKPVDMKRRFVFEDCEGLQEFWEERFEYIKNLGHYFTVFDFHAIFDATSKEQLDQLVGIDKSCAGMNFALAV